MQIGVWPERRKPSFWAAAFETSITRPFTNGPRSLMRSTTAFPFFLLITRTLDPKGRLRCAAVMPDGFMRSPEAVFDVSAYHEARPHWAEASNVETASSKVPAAQATSAVVDFRIPEILQSLRLEGPLVAQ